MPRALELAADVVAALFEYSAAPEVSAAETDRCTQRARHPFKRADVECPTVRRAMRFGLVKRQDGMRCTRVFLSASGHVCSCRR